MMLVNEMHTVGNNLLGIRKKKGMTQAEVAEAAGLSDRTYAEIERGTVNMRVDTLLRICHALCITPDDILTEESGSLDVLQEALFAKLSTCCAGDRQAALSILSIFLRSVADYKYGY